MGGYYFFVGSNLEKYGKFWKNGRFSGRIWPDWGNTAWADMAGLGSIGLCNVVISKNGHGSLGPHHHRPHCSLSGCSFLTMVH